MCFREELKRVRCTLLLGGAGRGPSPGSDHERDEVILQQISRSWGTKRRSLVGDGQSCTPAGMTRCVAEARRQKFGCEAELLTSREREGFRWTRS